MEFVEVWPQLREPVLRSSRSRKVCMTCHFFRHRVAADGIPELTWGLLKNSLRARLSAAEEQG